MTCLSAKTTWSKVIKCLLVLIILTTTFLQGGVTTAQSSKAYDMVVNIKYRDFTYLYGNISGSPVRYIDYKVNNNQQEVFCLEREKPSPDGVGFTQGEKLDKGINYIVNNFFDTKEQLTGDAKKDFYITQMAIRVYQDGGSDAHLRDGQGNLYADPEGVIPRILKIVEQAKNKGLSEPTFNNKIEVTSENSNFTQNGDVFETGVYTVNETGTLESYEVTISGAPEGTEVVELSNNRFRLRTNASNIKETSYDVSIDVTGIFTNKYEYATHYISSDSEIQDVTGYKTYEETESINSKANAKLKISGSVEIQKIDEETFEALEGATFVVSKNGNEVGTVTTGENGRATLGNLPYGEYEVTEIEAPNGYILNDNTYSFQIREDGQVATITAPNKAVLGNIEIIKQDGETGGEPQGEAELDGAVFEVFNSSEELVDTLTIKDGKAITSGLRLGTYTIKEKTAPTGYLLNEEVYTVELEYEGQTVEVVSTSKTITNDVIKGKISLVKIGDVELNLLNRSEVKPTLEGVEFTIYDFKGKEVSKLVTDKNGQAETPLLPYGTYTVSETKAPVGYKPIEDFEVTINENNRTYFYVVENEAYRADLQIVKIDSETGLNIPVEGISFKIKNVATGEWVEQTVTYPTKETISEFQTTSDGTVNLPEPLVYGDYEIHEVTAPNGYVLTTEPIAFSVTEESALSGQTIVIEFPNVSQKGTIRLAKTGEMVTDVISKETVYGDLSEFVFEQKPLAGVEFELIAAEDIATGDGTVRYEKGTMIEQIVTGEDGTVISSPQYLGKYRLVEVKAPSGYVLSGQEYEVELTYAGQEVEVTSTSVSVENRWQELKIELEKHSEENIALEDVIYGVHNATNIVVNEEVILEKGSLVGLTITDENGLGDIKGQYPEMEFYAQELETIPNYVLDDTKHHFTYEASNNEEIQTISISKEPFINIAQKGTINITKTGDMLTDVEVEETEFGDKYNFIYEQRPLEGVTFEVIAAEDIYTPDGQLQYEEGTLVDEVTTQEDGTISTKAIHLGKYKIVEVKAPPGYVLSGQEYEVELSYAGQEVEITSTSITIENTLQELDLSVNKAVEVVTEWSDGSYETEMQPIEGIEFGIYTRDVIEVDGEENVPVNSLVALMTTDEEGVASVLQQFPEGDYYAKEVRTTEEHVLLQDEFDFNVTYQDNNKSLEIQIFKDKVFIGKENTNKMARNPIENELFTSVFTISKEMEVATSKDENLTFAYESEKLAEGNEFTVWNTEDEIVDTLIIGEEGKATSIALPVGTYTFQETKVGNENYKLNPTVYTVEITKDLTVIKDEDGGIVSEEVELPQVEEAEEIEGSEEESASYVEVTIQNDLIKKDFDLTKHAEIMDSQGETWTSHYEIAENVEFILSDSEGNVISRQLSNSDGEINFEGLPIGNYFLEETKAISDEYRENTTIYEVEVTKDGVTIKDEGNVISQDNAVTIENDLKRGTVEIIKVDADTQETLAGAEFSVMKEDGEEITTISTESNGTAVLELSYGTGYKLVETKAPEGYVLDETVYAFEILEDGEVVTISVENEKITQELPQTGESSMLPFWIGGGILTVLGVALFVRSRK